MKTLLLRLVSVFSLAGCAIVPAYGPPGAYYAPAPVMVVPAYGGYGYYRGPRHRYWR